MILIQIIFVFIAAPLMIVYYSSNENDPFVRRIFKSFRAQLPLFICLLLLVVPTYCSKLAYYDLPLDIAEKYNEAPYAKMDFMLHTYTVTTWLGQLAFAFFAGVGLIMMPYDLLMEFIYRPSPIDERNFSRRKNILLPMVLKLRTEVKRLDKERFNVENMQGLTGYWKQYLFNKEVRILETETLKMAKEFKKLEDQAFYAKNVEPCYYYWLLFLSIMSFIFTVNWYAVLLLPLITDTDFNPLQYISQQIQKLNNSQAQFVGGGIDLGFINALIFLLLTFFLQAVGKKGNETLGYRFATFTFYSMQPNETLANAFIFNALLNCALQAAIVQYLLQSMTYYANNSNALLMSYKIRYSNMMCYFKGRINIFEALLLLFSILTVLSLIWQGANRINFTEKSKKDVKK